jgi:hypothetical protein
MAAPSKTITIRLPASFADEVDQRAKANNTTAGTWVRQVVIDALNDVKPNSNDARQAANQLDAGKVVEQLQECMHRIDELAKTVTNTKPIESDAKLRGIERQLDKLDASMPKDWQIDLIEEAVVIIHEHVGLIRERLSKLPVPYKKIFADLDGRKRRHQAIASARKNRSPENDA